MSFKARWSEAVFHCPICQSRLVTGDALCAACLIRGAAAASNEEPGMDWGIASNWRLFSVLDANEHGTIYLVERDEDGRGGQVGALHLSAQRVSMPGAADRLDAERRRLMALEHQTIVPILDVGLTDTGQLFVVFEHARGRLLRAYLQARTRHVDEIEGLFNELAAALDHVHQAELAHGAVSASSVIVTGDRIERRARLLGMGVNHLRASVGIGAAPTIAEDLAELAALRASVRE